MISLRNIAQTIQGEDAYAGLEACDLALSYICPNWSPRRWYCTSCVATEPKPVDLQATTDRRTVFTFHVLDHLDPHNPHDHLYHL